MLHGAGAHRPGADRIAAPPLDRAECRSLTSLTTTDLAPLEVHGKPHASRIAQTKKKRSSGGRSAQVMDTTCE
jgi:hypothetical protein